MPHALNPFENRAPTASNILGDAHIGNPPNSSDMGLAACESCLAILSRNGRHFFWELGHFACFCKACFPRFCKSRSSFPPSTEFLYVEELPSAVFKSSSQILCCHGCDFSVTWVTVSCNGCANNGAWSKWA